jgi:SUMO ligase MMS21 Smc5/6 complex component
MFCMLTPFFFSKNTDREAEHRAWCDQVRNSRAGPGKVASCCVALSHASSYHARLVIYPQVVQVLPATEHAPNKLKKKSMRETIRKAEEYTGKEEQTKQVYKSAFLLD